MSTKLLLLVTCSFGIVMFATYEADLTTKMTVTQQATPLRSFTDVYNTGKKLLVRKGTAQLAILRGAKEGQPLHKIYSTMDDSNIITESSCEHLCIEDILKVALPFVPKNKGVTFVPTHS